MSEALVVCVAKLCRNDRLGELPTDHRGAGVSEGSLGGRIPFNNAAVVIDCDDAIERDLDDSGVAQTLHVLRVVRASALEKDAELKTHARRGVEHLLVRRLDLLTIQLDDADHSRHARKVLVAVGPFTAGRRDAENRESEHATETFAMSDLLAGQTVVVADIAQPNG